MTLQSLPPLLLSPDELIEITGFKVITKQIYWLRAKGWRFEVNGNNRPVVARKYAEKMLGCGGVIEEPTASKPNFRALLGA